MFPLEAEGSSPGSAASLVLCSGFDSGELKTAVYMLRLDQSFNVLYMFYVFQRYISLRFGQGCTYVRAKVVSGDDHWKFDCTETGNVTISGLRGSVCSFFHNRPVRSREAVMPAHSVHILTADAAQATELFRTAVDTFGCLLILCSHSSGLYHSVITFHSLNSAQQFFWCFTVFRHRRRDSCRIVSRHNIRERRKVGIGGTTYGKDVQRFDRRRVELCNVG